MNTGPAKREMLSARELLSAPQPLEIPVGTLARPVTVHVGTRLLCRVARAIIGLSNSDTCSLVERHNKPCFEGISNLQGYQIPLTRLEEYIHPRLAAGAARFRASITRIEWNRRAECMTVYLVPQAQKPEGAYRPREVQGASLPAEEVKRLTQFAKADQDLEPNPPRRESRADAEFYDGLEQELQELSRH